MTFAEAKAELAERREALPAAELCLSILEFLERTPPDQLEMLTFTSLCNASGRTEIDADLVAAVTALTSSGLCILDAKALFIDENDESYELSKDEIKFLTEYGELVHPETGVDIESPASKVIPFFVPTQRVLGWYK